MKLGGWQIPILLRIVLGVAISLLVLLVASLLLPVLHYQLRLICLLLGLCVAILALITLVQARRSREDRMGGRQAEVQPPAHPQEKPAPKPPIPKPPTPDFEHPYPLQANFTGRLAERRMLTEWLTTDSHPVLALVAIGGMGKSALTWAWVQRDVLGLPLPGFPVDKCEPAEPCRVPDDARPDGIFWWSFYERDSTFEAFLSAALVYASGGKIVRSELPSTHDRMQALYNLLRERRFLLVLDGFERILRAYARLDAAYIGETFEEDERGDFRSCADPNAGRFLQDLAAGPMKSRVLITSRLFPRDLDGLAGCRGEDLPGMNPDDGVSFVHAQGVTKGTRAEIEAACEPYGYHPLALRLLAGVIAKDKRMPGDIRVAGRHPVLPELKGKEHHHTLQVSYDTLDERKRTLLSRIAAFRSPMAYDAVAVLNPYKKDHDFENALQELIDRGLLLFDRKDGRYDLHPIVRRHAYERLSDRESVHARLRDYLASVPAEASEVKTIEDLAPVVELYHHTVGAGLYDEAYELYRDRLRDSLFYRFGAYQTRIELLCALFPDGEDRPPRLASERAQAWTLNELAICYSLSTQPRRALRLYEMAAKLDEAARDWPNFAMIVHNVAENQLRLGELAEASHNLERARDVFGAWGRDEEAAVNRREFAWLLAYAGSPAEALREVRRALKYFRVCRGQGHECVAHAHCALVLSLARRPRSAQRHARRALALAHERYERYGIRARWLLGDSLVALASQYSGRREELLTEAESCLGKALTRCRRINLVELEPDILLAWARWHRAKGDPDRAKKDAEDALYIADRCEYRLVQADCHNFLALRALEAGNRDEAVTHAEKGYERAWCDGPPYSYKPALDEAERLLKTLGAPLPKMRK